MQENNKIKILLIDDEPDIIDFLKFNLIKEGYQVSSAIDSRDAIKVAMKELPDLIILDIMMPGIDGVELCKEIKEMPQFSNTLVAFLTARSEDYSQIAGFEVGGDDYITKPIRPRVLIARIKALLKRKMENGTEVIQTDNYGDLKIDYEKRAISIHGKTIDLPKKEFDLLTLLCSKPGKIFSREEIYTKLWGDDLVVGDRTLDVYIRKIREKIGEDYIKTSKGVGYSFTF